MWIILRIGQVFMFFSIFGCKYMFYAHFKGHMPYEGSPGARVLNHVKYLHCHSNVQERFEECSFSSLAMYVYIIYTIATKKSCGQILRTVCKILCLSVLTP